MDNGQNNQGNIEALGITSPSPFWVEGIGWLKASLLEQGMILLDRNNQEVEILSQFLLSNHPQTVYNFEVQEFHTYHISEHGVWVHNADCCGNNTSLASKWSNIEFSSRHSLDSLSIPKKTGNTIVYASKKDINADIQEIREKGESIRSGNTFEVSSGRVYEIHGNSVHPVSGPQTVNITSIEYKILALTKKEDGVSNAYKSLEIQYSKGILNKEQYDRTKMLIDMIKDKK